MLHFSLLGLKTGKGSEKHGISLAKSDTLARNEILAYNLTFLFFFLCLNNIFIFMFKNLIKNCAICKLKVKKI